MSGLLGGLVCTVIPIGLLLWAMVFWVMMIAECLTKEDSNSIDKLTWFLAIFLLFFVGALLYRYVRRPARLRELNR